MTMMRDNNVDSPGQQTAERSAWEVIEQACAARITGELTLTTDLEAETHVYLTNGMVYFAEQAGDSLPQRLVGVGAISDDQRERGVVLINGVEHLGRMFERDASIDRDAVELAIDAITEETLTDIAERPVSSSKTVIYRHHPSGIGRWFSPHQAVDQDDVVDQAPVATIEVDDHVETSEPVDQLEVHSDLGGFTFDAADVELQSVDAYPVINDEVESALARDEDVVAPADGWQPDWQQQWSEWTAVEERPEDHVEVSATEPTFDTDWANAYAEAADTDLRDAEPFDTARFDVAAFDDSESYVDVDLDDPHLYAGVINLDDPAVYDDPMLDRILDAASHVTDDYVPPAPASAADDPELAALIEAVTVEQTTTVEAVAEPEPFAVADWSFDSSNVDVETDEPVFVDSTNDEFAVDTLASDEPTIDEIVAIDEPTPAPLSPWAAPSTPAVLSDPPLAALQLSSVWSADGLTDDAIDTDASDTIDDVDALDTAPEEPSTPRLPAPGAPMTRKITSLAPTVRPLPQVLSNASPVSERDLPTLAGSTPPVESVIDEASNALTFDAEPTAPADDAAALAALIITEADGHPIDMSLPTQPAPIGLTNPATITAEIPIQSADAVIEGLAPSATPTAVPTPTPTPSTDSIPVPEDVAAAVRRAISAIEAATVATTTGPNAITFGPLHVTSSGQPPAAAAPAASTPAALEYTPIRELTIPGMDDGLAAPAAPATGLTILPAPEPTTAAPSADAEPVTQRRGALRRLIDSIRRRS